MTVTVGDFPSVK